MSAVLAGIVHGLETTSRCPRRWKVTVWRRKERRFLSVRVTPCTNSRFIRRCASGWARVFARCFTSVKTMSLSSLSGHHRN
ncbi:hypothetical protein [Cronobacter condimenti]|uniref:hypothetical protein n=1 Tax=Cronobacter condimenti TaxID=1163710 RepID=UPI003899090A